MRCGVRGVGRTRRGAAAVLLALAAAAPALAQSRGGGGASLWSVMYQGMEWPAYLILLGSVTLITLIVEHFLTVRRASIAPPAQVKKARTLIERRAFRDCVEHLRRSRTFFAQTMTASLNHARHGFDAMHEAAIEKSSEMSGHMFRKVEFMNHLGQLGPLLGLLGTVLGMIYAFGALGEAGGEAGAGELARGISLALVNTLLGLALAVVGLGFYGVCRNRTESLTVEATVQVLDLLEYFRPAPAVSAAAGLGGVSPPAAAAPGTPLGPATSPPAAPRPAVTPSAGSAPARVRSERRP